MNPISGKCTYEVQSSSANPAQAAGKHLSGGTHSLTLAMLSNHTVIALSLKATQGNELEKQLAGFAQDALASGLQLSPHQPDSEVAQFVVQHNQGELTIKARLNERSELDMLSVGLQRGSETTVSMTLPSLTTAVGSTARRPLALLDLPSELMLQIAGDTGNRSKQVNLSLRLVNKQMRVIADDQLSSRQRFLIENGQKLQASGHRLADMSYLFSRPEDRQKFVLAHGHTLKASGHSPDDMIALARRPEDRQKFVLAHGHTLKASGHSLLDMSYLASRPEDLQKFILAHGHTLKASGHSPGEMLYLAGLPEDRQKFVLAHGYVLKTRGRSPGEMWYLASLPEDRRNTLMQDIGHGGPANKQFLSER